MNKRFRIHEGKQSAKIRHVVDSNFNEKDETSRNHSVKSAFCTGNLVGVR
jgi:hypothetical protein